MVLYGKDVYTDIDYTSDKIKPDTKSIQSISSDGYFESIIQNCIQFFDKDYLFAISFGTAYERELNRILKEPERTNNLGQLIYNMYHKLLNSNIWKENDIRHFIYNNFFHSTMITKSIDSLYFQKKRDMIELSKRLGMSNIDYDRVASIVDIAVTGLNYDFSKIGINCIVYRSISFNIKPSALYQVAMSYDAIILSHGVCNKEFWQIDPIEIGGKQYTNVEECLNILQEKNILVLSCNDDHHTIKNIKGKCITMPRYPLISELYLEK